MKEYIVRCENNKFTLENEIVHCKDCEFCIVEEPISRGIIPDMYCRIWQSSVSTDDFCSYGERKEKVQLSQETPTNSKTETVDTSTNTPTDLISRQAAIDVIMSEPMNEPRYPAWWADKIKSLPPLEPTPVCEDAISRADTLKAICAECGGNCWDEADKEAHCSEYAAVKSMPPVEPKRPKRTETIMVDGEPTEIDPLSYEVGYSHGQSERPKGEWIVSGMEDDGRYMGSRWYACDQCGRAGDIGDNFCRGCGADMRGDNE